MKRLPHLLLIIAIAALAVATGCRERRPSASAMPIPDKQSLVALKERVDSAYATLCPKVVQPAEGFLQYPYCIPAGFYKQMWDWDAFYISNHLATVGEPEYLRWWALNLLAGADSTGFVAGCATTKGPRSVYGKFAMKPYLSQGVYLASKNLGDFSWIEPHYDELMASLEYRDKTQLDSVYNCYFWEMAMQSGADNNPAMNYFKEDPRSFLAPDASVLQLREIMAQAHIARELGKTADYEMLKAKAGALQDSIKKHLWNEEDQIYYTVDRETGTPYRRVSFSSFLPLIQPGILTEAEARATIDRYLVSTDHMKSAFGLRSLSKQDVDYNNKNIIKPFSNWQGPVWPIANYIYSIGLKNYGYDDELAWMASTLGNMLVEDINTCGSMHENYDAETGAPLAPDASYVDADGKFVGFIGWNLCIANLLDGVVNDRWMMLEIPPLD